MQGDSTIQVKDLTYAYAGGQTALQHVSFDVSEGASVGLVGPNGAGKTTLFLCLAGVLRVGPAQARVGGLDAGVPAQRKRLFTRVGLVFQNSDDQILSATVLDDVAFGPLNLGLPPQEIRQRVSAALEQVGLSGFEQRVPFHLSGGEKRRVALAGVLAMRPAILLLDEPSMFLDPRGRRELIGLVNAVPTTKLIASHDLEMILETCGRVLVLDRGEVIADGPTADLLADPDLMEAHGLEVPHSLRVAGGDRQRDRETAKHADKETGSGGDQEASA